MEKILSGKNILITGGTSGLGSAFVLKALEQGARVFFTYSQDAKAAEALIQKGAEGYAVDLSKTAEIDGFVKQIREKIKTLEVLIHNAAAVRDHTIQNMSEEDWDYVLNVDLKAPYYLTKKTLPLLFKKAPENKKGVSKIFMITSRVGVMGGYGVSNYAAAKAGLIALAKSLAQELGKKEILVNAVNPGFMMSKMTEGLPEQVFEANKNASPIARFSEPDEVAEFLVYLASDFITQVTGQVFHFESRKI
jgi:3-oxoacyl-[acyl-carrier protein] reductase